MQETIGQRLKREREARYLSLEKAAQETRIRRVFLQALEADDYSVMPSAAQGRGFLRNYAEYLNLNIDELIAEIQRNPLPPAEEVSGPLPQVNFAETEIPPLTETRDETPAPRFFDRWLKRKPNVESTPEADSDPVPQIEAPVLAEVPSVESLLLETKQEEEKPKTRGRKKKKVEEVVLPAVMDESDVEPLANLPAAEILPEAPQQVEVIAEAQQGWWGRTLARFGINVQRRDSAEAGVIIPKPLQETAAEIPQKPEKPADVIMAEIGATLRERRELISLTVEEVERHTHLRAVFVKALEEGAFEKLPSTVQTRGMLSNYASFLDLDVDAVLLRYADALQARRREKYAETPRDQIQTQVKPTIPVLRTFIAGDLIFGVLMAVALVALAVWGVNRIVSLQAEEQAQPTAPSIVDVLGDNPLPTASPELTFVAVDDPSLATLEPGVEVLEIPDELAAVSNANVVVSIFALERVFVRVSVDGETAFEGRMLPRESKVFDAENQVVILTGDGSALRITYNGADLGLMGGPGEVVNRVYLISGVATPTATIPPTATNTPLTTPTFTPTATSTPSATPTLGQ